MFKTRSKTVNVAEASSRLSMTEDPCNLLGLMIDDDHRILFLFACEIIDMICWMFIVYALHTSVFLYQYHGNSLFQIKNFTFLYR